MTRESAAGARTHTVSVRLSPDELTAWRAARDESNRKELGAWVREVVTDALNDQTDTRRRAGAVPTVNREAYKVLAQIGNNLNQLARWANSEGRCPETQQLHAIAASVRAAIYQVTGKTSDA